MASVATAGSTARQTCELPNAAERPQYQDELGEIRYARDVKDVGEAPDARLIQTNSDRWIDPFCSGIIECALSPERCFKTGEAVNVLVE